MQAIPRSETSDGLGIPDLKSVFTSRWKNGKIIQADYSQIELRIIGILSKDTEFMSLFANGADPHQGMGNELYKFLNGGEIPDDKDTLKKWRRIGKTANFAIIYGQTPQGMSEKLGCDLAEAERIQKGAFARYRLVKKLLDGYVRQVKKNGWVESPVGRKRHLPISSCSSRHELAHMYREASNSPIQSAASDVNLAAALRVDREFAFHGMKSVVIGLVHDAILVDSPPNESDMSCNVIHKVMTTMQEVDGFSWLSGGISLEVEVEVGDSWSRGKKWKPGEKVDLG
jgi:DNA polymerase-1